MVRHVDPIGKTDESLIANAMHRHRTASERTFRTGKSEALAMPDSSAGNRQGMPQRSASMDLPPHAPSIEGSTAT